MLGANIWVMPYDVHLAHSAQNQGLLPGKHNSTGSADLQLWWPHSSIDHCMCALCGVRSSAVQLRTRRCRHIIWHHGLSKLSPKPLRRHVVETILSCKPILSTHNCSCHMASVRPLLQEWQGKNPSQDQQISEGADWQGGTVCNSLNAP